MPKISDGRLALGLLAVFAIWLFAVLPFLYGPPPRFAEISSLPQAHADQTEQQSAAKPDGSVTAPFFIRIPKTAKAEADEAGDRREKTSTDRWLMIFTGAVALFTLLLVGATVMLYFAGEKQLRLASETGKRQSDEMQKSIAVANRSATVAENALIATDRAWISIKAKIIAPLVFERDRIQIGVGFNMVNVGKSPATHVQLWAELCPDIVEAKNQGDKAAEVAQMNLLDFGVVLFPGEERKVDLLERAMKADDFRRIIEVSKISAKERGGDWDGSLANPAVMVCVTYKLSGSRRHRHTVILYEVNHIEASHLGWDGSECETEPFNMMLVQTLMSGQVT